MKNTLFFSVDHRRGWRFLMKISDELHLFSQDLQQCLSPDIMEELARQAGFTKRKSKY